MRFFFLLTGGSPCWGRRSRWCLSAGGWPSGGSWASAWECEPAGEQAWRHSASTKRQSKFKIKQETSFKTQRLHWNCLGIFIQTVMRLFSCTHNIFKRSGTLWYRHDQLKQLPWPWRGQQGSDLCQTRCSKSPRRNTQHRPADSPASSS